MQLTLQSFPLNSRTYMFLLGKRNTFYALYVLNFCNVFAGISCDQVVTDDVLVWSDPVVVHDQVVITDELLSHHSPVALDNVVTIDVLISNDSLIESIKTTSTGRC